MALTVTTPIAMADWPAPLVNPASVGLDGACAHCRASPQSPVPPQYGSGCLARHTCPAISDAPLTQPPSSHAAAARLERLAGWGAQLVEDGQAPFTMTLVARHGKIAHVATAGEATPGSPIQLDALCRMHSMSKPITSVALMMLHEEGRFQLDDPAWKYLGDKWRPQNMRVLVPGGTSDDFETVPCERAVSCHHLLTHTAGLSYGLNPTDGRTQSPVAAQEAANPLDGIYERMGVSIHSALGAAPLETTLAQFVDKLAECPLMYQPGEKWHYSLATDVCGMLVEAISGVSFWQFLETRLFLPLGMVDTFFVIPPEKAGRQADVYRPAWDDSDTPPSPMAPMTSIANISRCEGQDFSTPHVYEMGGGGLVSCLADYTQFALMLLNKGELDR